MQRPGIILAALMVFGFCDVQWQTKLSAQSPRSKTTRDSRAGTHAGEVIAPADRSERWKDQLVVGSPAPEFRLLLLDKGVEELSSGKEDPKEISLRELRSARPAVLVFGSMTCPPFRGQLDGVDEVYEDFKERAEFLSIYIREAHPDPVLSIVAEDGREALLQIRQAEDFPSRITSAAACQRSQELSLPIAVDDMDDSVGKAYSGWPNRMVVVGTDGNIAYATDPVPGGTNAQLPRAWLEKNLKADGG